MDMQHLRPMGDLGNIITLQDFSIRDDELIQRTIAKSNVVINLIGQNYETWNYDFNEVHVNFPAKLARMCANTPRVERLIQVSCLGADTDSPSARLATKAAGDEAVQAEFPGATLLRCGPLIGVEDRFYNDLALWRYSGYGVPVVDGGHSRVQPVYVCDVAQALYNTLEYNEARGTTYELGGPSVMQMKELAQLICDEQREDLKLRQVPTFLAKPVADARAWLTRRIPMHMLTRDVVMTASAIAEGNIDKVAQPGSKGFTELGVVPHKTTSGVAIDHVRHWRKGGYNQGTNVPEQV